MELVSQHGTRTGAITRPFARRAVIVAAAITAALIAATLAFTSPQVSPTVQTGNHLLDPALIQVREGERLRSSVGTSAGNHTTPVDLSQSKHGPDAGP